jgi:hypothetical protein
LSASSSDIGLMAANLCFDLIELTDTLQQIGGERCRLSRVAKAQFAVIFGERFIKAMAA